MLTKGDIRLILDIIGRPVVVEPTAAFPYYVTEKRGFGYSLDKTVGSLQAKLSIMLEAAARKGH